MSYLNERATQLKPSETLAIKARAAELKASGREIIDLSAGEPDIDTPEYIKDAARKALLDGKTKYTAVNGILELRTAISEKLKAENGISASPSEIIITNGGKQALHEIFAVTLNPGDEVIVPAPYWVSYPSLIELAGGKVVFAETSPADSYKMQPDKLKELLSERTRFVIINSPSNPTGAGYTADEMKALGAVMKDSSAMVVSDEVYEKLVFPGFQFFSFASAVPEMADRTITVQAFSKTYSMTGWRVGYACGPSSIISAMGKYQSQITSNVNSIAQYAALGALTGSSDFLDDLLKNYERRLDMAIERIEKIEGLTLAARPDGAFYLFVRIDELLSALSYGSLVKDSVTFAEQLMEKAGVAVVPGEAFGDNSAFRISISSSDENIKKGLDKIEEFVGTI